jgi:hypothetical protein
MIVAAVAGGFILVVFLLTLAAKAGSRSRDRAVIERMNSKAFRKQQLRAREVRDSIDAEYRRRTNGEQS